MREDRYTITSGGDDPSGLAESRSESAAGRLDRKLSSSTKRMSACARQDNGEWRASATKHEHVNQKPEETLFLHRSSRHGYRAERQSVTKHERVNQKPEETLISSKQRAGKIQQ